MACVFMVNEVKFVIFSTDFTVNILIVRDATHCMILLKTSDMNSKHTLLAVMQSARLR